MTYFDFSSYLWWYAQIVAASILNRLSKVSLLFLKANEKTVSNIIDLQFQ